jgi:valyl-tRNA synthetase
VEVILHSQKTKLLSSLERNRVYLESLARAEKVSSSSSGEKPRASVTSVVGNVEVFLPLKGLINLDDEASRIQKEIAKGESELTRTNLKLHNEDFLHKARPEAIEKEKQKAKALTDKGEKLKEGLERVLSWKKEE